MTDKKTEALKLALEGLEKWHFDKDPRGAADYIAAIKEALAQQPAEQQEPVAWLHNGKLHEFDPSDWATGPVTPLYTSPPAKPWVGLTDEEIAVIAAAPHFVVDVARAIEQAHGITGETK